MRSAFRIASVLAVILLGAGAAQAEQLTPLDHYPLPRPDTKAVTAVEVDFPPGDSAAPHTHGEATVFAYVLTGTVVSQLGGQAPRTYHAGEHWFEPPGAHHLMTRNPSRTKPARLLVVFVAQAGAALKTDDHPPQAPPHHSPSAH